MKNKPEEPRTVRTARPEDKTGFPDEFAGTRQTLAQQQRWPRGSTPYPMYFTRNSEMGGKNSSNSVRSVSLIRKGITPR